MPIKEEDLKALIDLEYRKVKLTKVSYDGKTLSTRIPKEIAEELEIEKGYNIKWTINHVSKELKI